MTTAIPSVAAALDGVAGWRAEQEALRNAEIVEVEAQVGKLRAQIEQISAQIASLEELRAELGERDPAVEVVSRSYDAIFEVLLAQSASLAVRAEDVLLATQQRLDAVISGLPTSEVAVRVKEFVGFKQGSISEIPESYRAALMAHHQGVSDAIRSYLARQLEAPVAVDGPELDLDLVYGVDAPEGTPELLICVLPVPDQAFTGWSDRPEDLFTLLGARVVQGIYETTRQTGPRGAQAVCGGHQGLLAIEVDIEGAKGDVGRALADNLAAVLGSAPELAAARIRVTPRRVDVDYLLPPDVGEEA